MKLKKKKDIFFPNNLEKKPALTMNGLGIPKILKSMPSI